MIHYATVMTYGVTAKKIRGVTVRGNWLGVLVLGPKIDRAHSFTATVVGSQMMAEVWDPNLVSPNWGATVGWPWSGAMVCEL